MKWERQFVLKTYRAILLGLILILPVNLSAQDSIRESFVVTDSLCLIADRTCNAVDSFEKALDAVNVALSLGTDLDVLKRKVDTLRASGREEEALALYKNLLFKIDSINDEAFLQQVDQVRSLNDLNDHEKQARILQIKEEEIAMSRRLLAFSGFILLILFLLLCILGHFYRRANRLKDELLCEKESLVESEKQLRVMKEKAVEANHMKTAFISNISHEVRTPLNAIVGFSELLTDKAFEEEEKVGFATTINHSSELLMNLINDVLDLSRLEAGNVSFTVCPVDLVEVCQKALDAVMHRVSPNVRLSFSPGDEHCTLNTDPFRLQQLLVNLLFNAAKFTIEGEINLSFTVDDENRKVRFAVTDTGCGIPADKQDTIFERFEKLDEFAQGTGLGLPICQIIARRLGGQLFVDPSYTEGACLVFIHPCDCQIGKTAKEQDF